MATFDITVLMTFAVLWAAIVPTPGANSLLVTHLALTRGWAHVLYAIAGNMAGIFLLAMCALLGMALVLEAFPWLRLAVHVFGGGYLIYFGARLLGRARRPAAIETEQDLTSEPVRPGWKTVGLGFATALSNAQAIVFITSIFAVSGVLQANVFTGLGCIAIMIILNATYLALLGWLFLRPTFRGVYLRFRRWIEGTIGVLFVFFGARLVLKELARL